MSINSAMHKPAVTIAEINILPICIKKISLARTKTVRLKEASAKLRFLLLVMVIFYHICIQKTALVGRVKV